MHLVVERETEGKADIQELVVDYSCSAASSDKLLIGPARQTMRSDLCADRRFGKVIEAEHTTRGWIEYRHMHP